MELDTYYIYCRTGKKSTSHGRSEFLFVNGRKKVPRQLLFLSERKEMHMKLDINYFY